MTTAATTTHLRNQNLITWRNTTRNSLAILIQSTRTDRQNPCLVQFLDARFRQEDATRCLGLHFDTLDQDTIEQRRKGFDGFECCRLFILKR